MSSLVAHTHSPERTEEVKGVTHKMGGEVVFFPELVKDTILFSDEEFCDLQSTGKTNQGTRLRVKQHATILTLLTVVLCVHHIKACQNK